MNDLERTPLLGRQPRRLTESTQRKLACAAVLIAEMLERVACYSLSGTLVFFLTKAPLCWDSSPATAIELIFTAVMYTTGLFGGWVSDSYLGRYPTIIGGYLIYFFGYWYMPTLAYYSHQVHPHKYIQPIPEGTPCNSTWNTPRFCSQDIDGDTACSASLIPFVIFIAIGAGVVRTNLAPFGGDQVGFNHADFELQIVGVFGAETGVVNVRPANEDRPKASGDAFAKVTTNL